jgi:hypothetical protein
MGIWKIFSERKAMAQRAGRRDIYQYEELPETFRVQAAQIIAAAIGPEMLNCVASAGTGESVHPLR